MTAGHIRAELLHDLADGLLGPEDGARVDAHLAACRACADEADAIRRLRAATAALPGSIDPGTDLRPGIRALHVRPARLARVRLAAAAVLVLAAAGTLAVVALRGAGPDQPALAEGAAGGRDAAEVVLALDSAYERAGDELKARVSFAATGPGEEAARLVAADVAAVEGALARSRAALRADPASPVLRELVLAAHRQRLDVLRRAAALAAEMEVAS